MSIDSIFILHAHKILNPERSIKFHHICNHPSHYLFKQIHHLHVHLRSCCL